MLPVLVGFLALLLTICVARLAFLRTQWLHDEHPRRRAARRWLTGGLCAIATAFVLYLPVVDTAVDPWLADRLGWANTSDLGHILLTLVAWWVLGILSLRVLQRESPLDEWLRQVLARYPRARTLARAVSGGRSSGAAQWLWTLANIVTATAVVVVFALSALPDIEVGDMLELHDTGTRTLGFMYGAWAFLGGVLVVTASASHLRAPEAPRPALWVMVGVGLCGIGYTVTAAAVVAAGGTHLLHEHADTVMGVWAIPGLLLLSLSGAAGLLRAAQERLA
ncbi:hypothetical protein [Nocardia sp. IFM 10818]